MTTENKVRLIGASFIALIVITLISVAYNMNKKSMALPPLQVFGPKGDNNANHIISQFMLTDQLGNTVTKQTFAGKIYVADFFFATCTGICPIMNGNLRKVYLAYANDTNIMFLSHTVNPEGDSVAVLKDYADNLHVDHNKWKFVTGDKKQIYELARTSYLAAAGDGDGGAEDFLHTQNLVLIDTDYQIRGFYDGTDSTNIELLIRDIGKLKKE